MSNTNNSEATNQLEDCGTLLAMADARIATLERERDETLEMAARINRQRNALQAAVLANEERTREVVREAAKQEINVCYYDDGLQARAIWVHGTTRLGCVCAVANAIAERAAKQLAVAIPLSAEDRDILLRMRKSIQHSGEFTDLIDRLLGREAVP